MFLESSVGALTWLYLMSVYLLSRLIFCCCPAQNQTVCAMWRQLNWMGKVLLKDVLELIWAEQEKSKHRVC